MKSVQVKLHYLKVTIWPVFEKKNSLFNDIRTLIRRYTTFHSGHVWKRSLNFFPPDKTEPRRFFTVENRILGFHES